MLSAQDRPWAQQAVLPCLVTLLMERPLQLTTHLSQGMTILPTGGVELFISSKSGEMPVVGSVSSTPELLITAAFSGSGFMLVSFPPAALLSVCSLSCATSQHVWNLSRLPGSFVGPPYPDQEAEAAQCWLHQGLQSDWRLDRHRHRSLARCHWLPAWQHFHACCPLHTWPPGHLRSLGERLWARPALPAAAWADQALHTQLAAPHRPDLMGQATPPCGVAHQNLHVAVSPQGTCCTSSCKPCLCKLCALVDQDTQGFHLAQDLSGLPALYGRSGCWEGR